MGLIQSNNNDNTNTDNEESSNAGQFVYEKGALIGSGAYGKVYEALDKIHGGILAIKTIELPYNPEQLRKEIKSL